MVNVQANIHIGLPKQCYIILIFYALLIFTNYPLVECLGRIQLPAKTMMTSYTVTFEEPWDFKQVQDIHMGLPKQEPTYIILVH